jgi:tRNA U34 5-methylaminomethyl-2-thiouridine-forming methyltransferase MnmC
VCNCGAANKQYQVTYPDGTSVTFSSAISARVAAAKVSGATVTTVDKQAA